MTPHFRTKSANASREEVSPLGKCFAGLGQLFAEVGHMQSAGADEKHQMHFAADTRIKKPPGFSLCTLVVF
jgi:hypothetical protein